MPAASTAPIAAAVPVDEVPVEVRSIACSVSNPFPDHNHRRNPKRRPYSM